MNLFLNLPRFQKQMIAALADALLLPLAFFAAVILRYGDISVQLFTQYFWLIVAAPLISIPLFLKIGLYRAVVRYIDQKIVCF